ncbi:MAG: hypothetical protein IT308_01330 [Anaerolineaceae bacterium]|nr:hypothetical protein [Anaerolineaceae bacterium]
MVGFVLQPLNFFHTRSITELKGFFTVGDLRPVNRSMARLACLSAVVGWGVVTPMIFIPACFSPEMPWIESPMNAWQEGAILTKPAAFRNGYQNGSI